MVRAQILLKEDQYRYLKETSATSGESISALVRDAIARMQAIGERAAARQAAIDYLGSVEADATDIGRNHDRYLGEMDSRG